MKRPSQQQLEREAADQPANKKKKIVIRQRPPADSNGGAEAATDEAKPAREPSVDLVIMSYFSCVCVAPVRENGSESE
jgi:hypothetical protein